MEFVHTRRDLSSRLRARPSWPRLVEWAAVAAIAGIIYVGGTALVRTGALDRVSLLHGPVPVVFEVLALAALTLALVRVGRRWWIRTLPAIVAVSGLVCLATATFLRKAGIVGDHYPPTFALWIGAVFVTAGAIAERGQLSSSRRLASMVAVPLVAAGAFLLINDHYGYWPTLGSLLGRPLTDQVSAATLVRELRLPAVAGRRGAGPPGTGQLAPIDVPATVSRFAHRPGGVWLPPAFFAARRPALPVVVMLGGAPGGPMAWPDAGLATITADAFAARHHGLAPILVFVDQNGWAMGDTECVDGPRGRAETYLSADVPRFVEATFGASRSPTRWAVVGFSEGGTCALDLALRHPNVYRHFVDLAGDAAPNAGRRRRTLAVLYGGDLPAMIDHDPAVLLRSGRYRQLSGWFASGGGDGRHIVIGRRLAAEAALAGVKVHVFVGPDGHNWQFASDAFRTVLPALAKDLGLS